MLHGVCIVVARAVLFGRSTFGRDSFVVPSLVDTRVLADIIIGVLKNIIVFWSTLRFGKRQKSCTLIVILIIFTYLTSPIFNSSSKSTVFIEKKLLYLWSSISNFNAKNPQNVGPSQVESINSLAQNLWHY